MWLLNYIRVFGETEKYRLTIILSREKILIYSFGDLISILWKEMDC